MAKFRKFFTGSGLCVQGGKDSSSNDELVWGASANDVLLHTSAPGSPFVNVGAKASKGDLKEAAIFCAKYSADWRDSKRDVIVNVFFRKDMEKDGKMKAGTWGVSKQERVKIKKADILKFEGKLNEGE